MSQSHIAISSSPSQAPAQSARPGTPDRTGPEKPLAYLELTPRQAFGVAYALIAHCRRVGPPRTELQHEIAGLRDFLLDLLDEAHVAVLLDAS